MTELMEALYVYAQEHGMAAFLVQEPEYEQCERYALEREEKLRAALKPDDAADLKALLDERDLQRFIRERAAFSAGFRMALELAR